MANMAPAAAQGAAGQAMVVRDGAPAQATSHNTAANTVALPWSPIFAVSPYAAPIPSFIPVPHTIAAARACTITATPRTPVALGLLSSPCNVTHTVADSLTGEGTLHKVSVV